MDSETTDRPDLTLTLDREGVITDVAPSGSFKDEALDSWRGRSWSETIPGSASRVAHVMKASLDRGESQCFQVRQQFPSGRELAVEYTTVSLGENEGVVAIGRSLESVSDLQSRLLATEKARMQDFWRMRDIESRYRALLDTSSEAVALVRAATLRVIEANALAARALGLAPGAVFLPDLAARDRKRLEAALDLVRSQGRAPSIVLRVHDRTRWTLQASFVTRDSDGIYLLRMSVLDGEPDAAEGRLRLEQMLLRFPDALVIADRDGAIIKANPAFLDLAQAGDESVVLGQSLGRWLSFPGEDFPAVLGHVQARGAARMPHCNVENELGALRQVDVIAVADKSRRARYVGLLLQEADAPDGRAGQRAVAFELGDLAGGLSRRAIRSKPSCGRSVETIEIRYIEDALAKSGGNRTLAAKRLGLEPPDPPR